MYAGTKLSKTKCVILRCFWGLTISKATLPVLTNMVDFFLKNSQLLPETWNSFFPYVNKDKQSVIKLK